MEVLKMTQTQKVFIFFCFLLLCKDCYCRKHTLRIESDSRKKIDLTTFGFLPGGELLVNLTNFMFLNEYTGRESNTSEGSFGFTLAKTTNGGISPDLEGNAQKCILQDEDVEKDDSVSIIFFRMDLNADPPRLKVERKSADLKHLQIWTVKENQNKDEAVRRRRNVLSDSYLFPRHKRDVNGVDASGQVPENENLSTLEGTTVTTKAPTGHVQINASTTPAESQVKSTTPTVSNLAGEKDLPKTVPEVASLNPTASKVSLKVTQVNSDKFPSPVEPTEPDAIQHPSPVKPTEPDVISHTSSVEPTEPDVISQQSENRQLVPVDDTIPITVDMRTGQKRYNTHFIIWIENKTEQGLYNLFFHNCDNYNNHIQSENKQVNFTVHLEESNYNGKNYLSAGEIPLPSIYSSLCIVYLFLGCIWFYVLKRATAGIFKTHYLMLIFLFVKSLSLLFHSLNFVFIRSQGRHAETFAILYYITYLMKGTLLFVTIVLIGAGWAFVKHILSDRDKKIFIFVIPLQILANVAQIIIEETEEGMSQYLLWKQLFIMVDLLCCGAILFPVVWSIRHLQDASQTDGKAAINLVKLKIFRHFYILIVCYIYFTRIIVYLLAMTVPFQYDWVCVVFKETAALAFFVITGYKFRPASDNPYLLIPQEDDEVEMDQVLTESGVYENVTRVNIRDPSSTNDSSTTNSTLKQRESSHEYD